MKYSLLAMYGTKWVEILTKSNNVTWGSNKDNLSVELSFNSLLDLAEGSHIQLRIDNNITFSGLVVKKVKSKLSYAYTCYDYAFYLNKNEAIIQFNKVTADVAIKQLCSKFGVKCNVVKISYIVQDSTETTKSGSTTTKVTTANTFGQKVVAKAKEYLGVHYVYGGASPSGFDCSGLVQYVYKQLGKSISRTTFTQINEGTAVSKSNLIAGDIVFFGSPKAPHHEGIYVGSGTFIEAPHTGANVRMANLNSRGDYAGARRIVASSSGKTVAVKKDVADTTITTLINKIYKDMTLSAIIDDILENATLALGTKYIKEMISDTLYIRKQSEYKIFPKFTLASDLIVNSSIEDMKNKVTVTNSDDTTIKVLTTVSDPTNIKVYGGLQEVLTTEMVNVAQAKNLANNFLKLNNKIFRDSTLNVVVLTDGAEIRANRFIGLTIASMGLNGWFNIKSCTNTLDNGQYKSSIILEW